MFGSDPIDNYHWRCTFQHYESSGGLVYTLDYVVDGRKARINIRCVDDGRVIFTQQAPRVMTQDQWGMLRGEVALSFLKSHAEKDAKSVGTASKEGQAFIKQFAAIMEYLSASKYPDGSERTTSTLTFFADDNVCKVVLNDRDQGKSLWSSGATPLDALVALEAMLRAGEGEWRASGPPQKKKGHKRT